jgi:hypothetical protein
MSATRVKQSAVIPRRASALWADIAKLDFKWWGLVSTSTFVQGGENQVNSLVKLVFADGASWTVRVTGISHERKSLEFELVETTPQLSVSGVNHEIVIQEVSLTDQAFISWTADYSSDASPEVIQDSKFKRVEAFRSLIQAAAAPAAPAAAAATA